VAVVDESESAWAAAAPAAAGTRGPGQAQTRNFKSESEPSVWGNLNLKHWLDGSDHDPDSLSAALRGSVTVTRYDICH
jgi:hypothetical protein